MKYNKWKYISVVLLALVVVGLIVVAGFQYYVSRGNTPVNKNAAIVVTINDDGFEPAEIMVKEGTPIIWKNVDGQPHTIKSGPFAKNTDLPELDSSQAIGPGASYEYTVLKKGTFGYYDDNHPSSTGQITVQ